MRTLITYIYQNVKKTFCIYSFLTEEDLDNIKKDLKEYSRLFIENYNKEVDEYPEVKIPEGAELSCCVIHRFDDGIYSHEAFFFLGIDII